MKPSDEKKREIENTEHNLRLHYETEKSALESMLRAVIPTQQSNIKTVLWMNFLILGVITNVDKNSWYSINTAILVTSGFAITVCLYALIALRTKHLGTLPTSNILDNLEENEWKKVAGLQYTLKCIEEALDNNIRYQTKSSDLTAGATAFTLISMILVIIKFSNQL